MGKMKNVAIQMMNDEAQHLMKTAEEKQREHDYYHKPVWALCGNGQVARIVCAPLGSTDMQTQYSGGPWTSRSRAYDTEQELIDGDGIKPSCSECGQPFATKTWCKPYPTLLVSRNLCFHCNHWTEQLPKIDKAGQLRIKGCCYSYNPEHPVVKIGYNDGQFYGFGGRTFLIKRFDNPDVVIETNNLWCGGTVPSHFATRFPDNAEFVETPKPIGHGQGYLR